MIKTQRLIAADAWDPAQIVLTMLLGLVGIVAVLAFLATAVARIGHPFELEWIEGGMREVVRRVLAGKPLYTPPSIEFVPFLYSPIYFHASALVARITGEGFLALRLVSLVSAIAALVLAARYAMGSLRFVAPRDSVVGCVAAGLLAASYAKSGAWFDLGRVDSLFLALVLGAIVALGGERPGAIRGAVAGVLLALAYHTKQSSAFVALPFLVLFAFSDRRALATFAGAFTLLAGAAHLAWQSASEGWYAFYVLDVPRAHRIEPAAVAGFWVRDLAPFALALGIALAPYVIPAARFRVIDSIHVAPVREGARKKSSKAVRRPKGYWEDRFAAARNRWRFDLALAIGLIGAAWISRIHEGGAENVLMPAHAAIAILAAVGLREVIVPVPDPFHPVGKRGYPRMALVLALVQFGLLAYNPLRFVPSREDRSAGTAIVDRIRALPGDVWTPAHGYLATLAGKESHAHLMAVIDVLRAAPGTRPVTLQAEIEQAFAARRFGALVLDDNQAFEPHLGGLYRPSTRLFTPEDRTFMPRSGAPLRPQTVWMPEPR